MNVLERIESVLASLSEAHSTLPSGLRRKINAELSRGVTSGNPYAHSFSRGLSAAFDVLASHGIEPARSVSPPLSDTGRMSIDLAFTNREDSFSPIEITNSSLIVSYAKMRTGVEFIAYVS
jgi:hypothetical protein